MKQYCLENCNSGSVYLVDEKDLIHFINHSIQEWRIKPIQKYDPPDELTKEEEIQRKKYLEEKQNPALVPLSQQNDF